ncbi:hypothetical protein EI74_0803 [Mycoplasma testudineum]|uniref:Uncharacterized protein n=1 Tax=Mycoplasma testudineum TaxID=244584 RepID=A0A4R6IDK7_9MOLU|nr:hypothetical protein [Mycoplasma testudineum]OYD26497.1 hypothetical protein CG473_03585 [Mycoplasma testudineum]TDO18985.1 hypothetical protein EI74_0803 [Mycoplasma testudineum]
MSIKKSELLEIESMEKNYTKEYILRQHLMRMFLKDTDFWDINNQFSNVHLLDKFAMPYIEHRSPFSWLSFSNILKFETYDTFFAKRKGVNFCFEEILYIKMSYGKSSTLPFGLILSQVINKSLNSDFEFRFFSDFKYSKSNYKNNILNNFYTNNFELFSNVFDEDLSTKISSLFSKNEKKRIMFLKKGQDLIIVISFLKKEDDSFRKMILTNNINVYHVVRTWETKSSLFQRIIKAIDLINDKFNTIW